jgi:hypothetical protein
VPTELGIILVRGYQLIDPDLCLPLVRALSISETCTKEAGCADPMSLISNRPPSTMAVLCFGAVTLSWASSDPIPCIPLIGDKSSASHARGNRQRAVRSSSGAHSAQVRSHVEKQIGLIAQGQAEREAVVAHTLEQFRQKFHFFVAKIGRMDALFEASFSPLASSGPDPWAAFLELSLDSASIGFC